MSTFQPEVNTLAVKGGYRPLYKLLAGERWRMLKRDGAFVELPTASQARAAAQAHVDDLREPALVLEQSEPTAFERKVADWKAGKDARHQALKTATFRDVQPASARDRAGRSVPIHYLGRRARA